MKTVFVALLIAILGPAEGFIPDTPAMIIARGLSTSTENAITHEDMTRTAHLKVAAEVLRDNPNPMQ